MLGACAATSAAPASTKVGSPAAAGAAATEPAAAVTVTVTSSPSAASSADPQSSATPPHASPSGVAGGLEFRKGEPRQPCSRPPPSGWYEAAFGSRPAEQGKVLYLTLDDGPGISTQDALDVLAANNAKATFFVVVRKPPPTRT